MLYVSLLPCVSVCYCVTPIKVIWTSDIMCEDGKREEKEISADSLGRYRYYHRFLQQLGLTD